MPCALEAPSCRICRHNLEARVPGSCIQSLVPLDYRAACGAHRHAGINALTTNAYRGDPSSFFSSRARILSSFSPLTHIRLHSPLRPGQEGCAQEEGTQEGRPEEGAQEGYAHSGECTLRHISFHTFEIQITCQKSKTFSPPSRAICVGAPLNSRPSSSHLPMYPRIHPHITRATTRISPSSARFNDCLPPPPSKHWASTIRLSAVKHTANLDRPLTHSSSSALPNPAAKKAAPKKAAPKKAAPKKAAPKKKVAPKKK